MNKKYLFFIFVIVFIISLNSTYALTGNYPYGSDNNMTGLENFPSNSEASVNWTGNPTTAGNHLILTAGAVKVFKYNATLANCSVTGTQCAIIFNASVTSCTDKLLSFANNDNTTNGLSFGNSECGAGEMGIRDEQIGGCNRIVGWNIDGTNQSVKIIINDSNKVYVYINGTNASIRALSSGVFTGAFRWGAHAGYATCGARISNVRFSVNNSNFSTPSAVVPDTTPPIINGTINNTAPKINQWINITFNLTDETGLAYGNITHNMSGTITSSNFTLSGTTAQISNRTLINVVRGSVINFTGWATDSSGNTKQNSTLITIVNTPPASLAIINSSDKNYRNNQTINWTATDADSDTLTFTGAFNGANFTTSQNNFTTNMVAEGIYYFNLTASDGTDKSATTYWNITLDTTLPIWGQSFLSNGTFFKTSQNLTYSCSDTNLFEVNTSISRQSTGLQVSSINYTNLTAIGIKSINLTIDTTYGDGLYNGSRWCGDSKNKDRDISYVTQKYENSVEIYTDTNSGLQLNITDGIFYKNIFTKLNEGDIDFQKATSFEDKINKENKVDAYLTSTSYTLPSKSALQLKIDSEINYADIIFTKQIKANAPISVVNDNLGTHLLIGTGKNRISYDTEDLVHDGFITASKLIGNIYYITIETSPSEKTKFKEGTVITLGKDSGVI